MSKKRINKGLKMHDLEKLSDFSRATINFYIHEGILPVPIKSAKNMAYYDETFVEKLRRVRELKKAGYSLPQIKQFMNVKQGEENDIILQALNNINRLLPSESADNTVTREQIKAIGFTDENLDELIKIDVIYPIDEDGSTFPSYSLTICKFVKYFLDFDIPLAVAKGVVEKIMDVTHLEGEIFIKYIRKPLIEKNATLEEQNNAVQAVIEKINALLPLIHLQLLKAPAERLFNINSHGTL